MKKAIAVVATFIGLAAFAGGSHKATAGEAKKETKPAAAAPAAAATDAGTPSTDAGTPAAKDTKAPAKK